MKLLIVSPRYHPHIGGVQYVVKSIAKALIKVGHDVTILAGEPETKKCHEELAGKIKVIRWPTWAPWNAYHIPRDMNELGRKLKELFREVDVIHVHSAHAVLPVYLGVKAKELRPDVDVVFSPHYHAHGHTPIRELFWRILWRRYVGKLVKYADKIHAVSVVEAERIVKHYPEAKDKLSIIPNGVEEDVFQNRWKGWNSDYIMYAGRIEKYKRLETAVDLVAELNKHGDHLRLLIVGQGSHLSKIKRYAQNKAPDKVEFMLPLPRKEYLELIANASAVINPSRYEAFSIFIAESLAIGTPAIVSPTIEKIYRDGDSSELLPRLTALSPIVHRFRLKILVNHSSEIKTWSEVVVNYMDLLYDLKKV